MRKKLLALILSLAALLSCLSACAPAATDRFYDMVEEMTSLEDFDLTLTIPYHGAQMVADGFVSRTNHTANLTVSLTGTGATDGVWTQLRIDENDVWLNVDDMSDLAVRFPLLESRAEEIEDFAYEQSGDWLHYVWQGDLWGGYPDLTGLLEGLWEGTRGDLSSHISGRDGSYTLDLSERAFQTALEHVAEDLVSGQDAWQSALLAVTEEEYELTLASMWDPAMLLDSLWTGWSEWLSAGAQTDSSLTLTLTRTEEGYQAAMTLDGEDWALTLTPSEPQTVSLPGRSMELGAYDDALYYLLTLSWQYIGEAYDGTQEETETMPEGLDASDGILYPMTTQPASGYSGIATVQYIPEEGVAATLPVLLGYSSNEVDSVNGDGVEITQLILYGTGWTQSLLTEAEGENTSYVASKIIDEYYAAFIDTAGYLLVQDVSPVALSTDGMSAAQGFSYRENDYSDTEARIAIACRPSGCTAYTVIELELQLAEMSEESKAAVEELFAFLHLELPISLDA